MKTFLNYTMTPAFALMLTACGGEAETPADTENRDSVVAAVVTYDELQKANWLLGTWENSGDGFTASENWEQVDDSTFNGKGLFLAGADTVQSEDLRIEERNGQLYYIPTVHEQNGGQPVRFTMTSATGSELVFENPGHDFPQKIAYTLVNPDSIVAVVSGIYESQESSESFPMKRVK